MNGLCNNQALLSKALDENDQLIRIFTRSIQTSKSKLKKYISIMVLVLVKQSIYFWHSLFSIEDYHLK